MTVADQTNPLPPTPVIPDVAPGIIGRLMSLMKHQATVVMIDQGIVSLGNFLMLGVLQRTLHKEEMGTYFLLFETINYLNGLQNALVIYPLLVKGAIGNRENVGRLATASIIITLALLPVLGGAIAMSVGWIQHGESASSVIGGGIGVSVVLALVLWQLQETMRRALMSDLRFGDAIWGDAISYLGQAGLVLALAQFHEALNLNRAFLIMAGTSAAATILQAWQVGLKPIRPWQFKLIVREFWHLGRWALLANASGIVTSLGYNWTLFRAFGPAEVAIFSAIVYCFKLANPLTNSLGSLITPAVARASTTDMKLATRSAIRYILLGGALLAPYYLLLFIFAPQILEYFSHHHENPYWQYPHLLRLFVANYTAVYLLAVICAWLGGLGRSRYNFYVSVVNIIVTLLIGLPLTYFYGVLGLILGGLFSAGISAATAIYFVYHLAHLPPTHGVAPQPTPS
jgi:O-antigen/teichoic acid export membrane protein